MKQKNLLLLLLIPLLSGCGLIQINKGSTPTSKGPTIGFYKTVNRGDSWDLKSDVFSVKGEAKSFAGSNVTAVAQDPSDEKTIYLGTEDKGLLYSNNYGDGWFNTLAGQGVINAVLVDPNDKCTLYAAAHNRIFKTSDCMREWKPVHLTSLEGEYFTAIAVDPGNSRNVYLGTSRGTIIRSSDAGYSWEVLKYVPSRITKILFNPRDSKEIYVTTISTGIFYSNDPARVVWENLWDHEVANTSDKPGGKNKKLKELRAASNYLDVVLDPSDASRLLYSNNYGIFRLDQQGLWQEIEILNKPAEEKVLSIAINTKNGQEVFFITEGAFYQTANGGKDWTVRKLPTPGLPQFLLLRPTNANEAYISYFKAR